MDFDYVEQYISHLRTWGVSKEGFYTPSLVDFSFHILFGHAKRIWPSETINASPPRGFSLVMFFGALRSSRPTNGALSKICRRGGPMCPPNKAKFTSAGGTDETRSKKRTDCAKLKSPLFFFKKTCLPMAIFAPIFLTKAALTSKIYPLI